MSTRLLNMASLCCDRQRLADLVLNPLQHFKLALGNKLTAVEVTQIKFHLRRDIQSDILVKVTDGEDLIVLLDEYYGLDNIRVLERVLFDIECHDLFGALLDWKENDYPVKSELFYECNYFPMWIKVIADLPWFFQNKKGILRSLKILFEIPEIESENRDLDPLVFMGVTASKRSTLSYVLLPVSMRRHIKMLLQDSDISIALERLRICGIYFSRKVGSRGQDNLSVSSSILSFSDHLEDVHVDRNGNGPVTNTGTKSNLHFYNDEPEKALTQNYQHSDPPLEYGPERNESGSEFVDQVRNQTEMSFSLYGYPNQAVKYFPPKKDLQVQALQPKMHSPLQEGTPSASEDRTNGVLNATVKVRPQLAYINHEIYRVQAESGVESVCEDKAFAHPVMPEEVVVDDSRDYLVEERVVAAQTPKQCYTLYEPLFNEQSMSDNQEHLDSTPSKLPSQRKSSLSNGKSYVSKLVIPINQNSNEPKRYSAEVLPNNFSSEMGDEHLDDNTGSLILGNPLFNHSESILVQTKDFSQVEQEPTWERFPGSFEGSSRTSKNDSRKWYEINGDTRAYNGWQMQPEPEPEASDFQEMTSYRFQDEDQYRTMQPEPEQDFFDAGRGREYPDGAQLVERYPENSPFRSSEGEIVKVKTKVLQQHEPQQAVVLSPDESVHSFDEDLNFNSSFLHPARLTLPRVAPVSTRQDDSLFPPSTLTRNQIQDKDLRHDSPAMYRKYQDSQQMGVFGGHHRPPMHFMNADSELQSDYADSVFTDTGSRSDRDGPSSAPPPYNPPPDYKFAVKKKQPMMSVDGSTTSTETPERVSRSPLLSSESITSIYREKERFLSREELNLSVRSAEEREEERQMDLCKELLTVAKGGNEEEVKKLLAEGAHIDYHNEFGHTAAMIASREGHLEVIEVLVAARADLNKQEWFGKSALHEAAWSGQHQVVHRLISAGANIDITDEEQRTPLHYAAMRGKRRIAEVLLLFGADVSLLNKEGKSAVELAYSYEHDDIVDVLLSSQDKRMRREMEGRLRKEKLRTLRSAASLPNLTKATSFRELARSKSRSDLRGKKRSACVIQ